MLDAHTHLKPHENTPRRVLVVEDNFFAAIGLRRTLESMGCTVVGPVPTLEEGLAMAAREPLEGAILDINIIGGTSAGIAEELTRRGTPFFFVTGYASPSTLPQEFKNRTRLHKPVDDRLLETTVGREFPGAAA